MERCKLEGWIRKRIAPLDLRAYQLTKLREVVAYTKAHSRFYAETLQSIDPVRDIRTLDDIAKLPFVTPEALAEQGRRMVCTYQNEISRIVTLQSSGTTGGAKRVFFTAEDQELTVDFFANGMQELARPGDTVLILLPYRTEGTVGDLLAKGLARMGQRPLPYGVVTDFDDVLRTMARERVQVMVGVPQQLLKIARLYQARKPQPDLSALRSVLLATDYVPDAVVSAVERALGCTVYETYGMTEMGLGGGVFCAARRGYHMREADMITEIVDPATGLPVPDGTYGEVVFTTLTRKAMPLIRYRTGDVARFSAEPCPCGSSLPLLEKIRCRRTAQLTLPNGETLSMPELDEAVFSAEGVLDFRAEITEKKLNILAEALLPQARLAAEIQAALERAGIAARLRRNGITAAVAPLTCRTVDKKATGKRMILDERVQRR